MPSSFVGVWRASRLVAGTFVVEMEPCARFRPESDVAIKPDGVLDVVLVLASAAAWAARERSRRALAFSLFSSWEESVGCSGEGQWAYDSTSHFRSRRSSRRRD